MDWLALSAGIGITLSLVIGIAAIAIRLSASPIHKLKLGVLSLASCWCLLALQVMPLPRPASSWLNSSLAEWVPFRGQSESASVPDDFFKLRSVAATHPEFETNTAPWSNPDSAAPFRSEMPVADQPEKQRPTSPSQVVLAPARTSPILAAPTTPIGTRLLQVFAAGSLACFLYLAVGWALLLRTVSRSTPANRRIRTLAKRLGAPAKTRIVVSRDIERPFCFGWRNAHVALPKTLINRGEPVQLEAVLRHEIAHLSQGHTKGRLLVALTIPLLYWNPLFWWVAREMRCSSEMLADDMAVSGIGKRRYIEELIALAENTNNQSMPWAAGPAVLGSRREFLERMETLMKRKETLEWKTTTQHSITRLSAAGAFVVLTSLAWGQIGAGPATPGEPASVPVTAPEPVVDDTQLGDPVAAPTPWRTEIHPERRSDFTQRTDAAGGIHQEGELPSDFSIYRPGGISLDAHLVVTREGALGKFIVDCLEASYVISNLERAETQTDPDQPSRTYKLRLSKNTLPGETQGVVMAQITGIVQGVHGIHLVAAETGRAKKGTDLWMEKTLPRRESGELVALRREVAQLRKSQRQLAESMQVLATALRSQGDSVESGMALPPAVQLNASIIRVKEIQGQTLVILNRGSSSGVKKGAECYIYSGSTLKATIKIAESDKDQSAGFVTIAVPEATIAVGDAVTFRY